MYSSSSSNSVRLKAPSLADYTYEGIVGVGTFGEVKLATSKRGEKVVIKKIDKAAVNHKLVVKEIEAGRRLSQKNIVKFLAHIEDDNFDYLVLEHIDGVNMFTFLNDRSFTPLPEPEAKKIFRQLVNGIMYCHSKGIVHRDLKLENIVITKKLHVKIIDFGLCDLIENESSICDGWVGSPDYVAPEILLRREYTGQKADVWSLGTLLYILLFSEIPFVREDRYAQLSADGRHLIYKKT
jgi:serine/threonine protein kinase